MFWKWMGTLALVGVLSMLVMPVAADNTARLQTTATPAPTNEPQMQFSGSEIAPNRTIQGTLTSGMPAAIYTFSAGAGQIVDITLISEDFDAYLELRGPDGATLVTDDDSAGNLNARIQSFQLPGVGQYEIRAGSFAPGAQGSFTLLLMFAAIDPPAPDFTASPVPLPTSTATPFPQEMTPTFTPTAVVTNANLAPPEMTPFFTATPAPQNSGDIALDMTVEGNLIDGQTTTYLFSAGAGQVVTITLTSTAFDPLLTLQDVSGVTLVTDDDGAGNLNSRIQFTLPEAGQYGIIVASADGIFGGAFSLSLASGGISEPTEEPTIISSPPGAIAMGETVSGALTLDAQSQTYTFNGESGQLVTIEASSDQFDVFITLNDPAGMALISDDDSAGSLNARISSFRLPANGQYSIVVSSFSSGVSGDYTLSLLRGGEEPTPPPPTSSGEMAIGQSVDGVLSSSEGVRYTFSGEAGQTISIVAISEAFDTYLSLQDPTGLELASDDDSAGNLDSRIGPLHLPATGLYTIVLTSFDSSFGAYSISLMESVLRPIEYTQTVEGALEVNSTASFTFTGEAGDVITIQSRSTDFDTYLSLTDSTGITLVENDDAGGGTDSLIGPYTLPYSGEYQINLRSYDTTAAGSYTLSLETAALLDIAFDEPQTARFSEGETAYYYRFEGLAGEVINVQVLSGNSVDTALKLLDPDGYEVFSDDDGGPGFDPEIFNHILSQSGTFILAIQAAAPSGEVQITLQHQPVPSLDSGPQIVQLSDKQYQSVLTFEGRAGETVQLALVVTSAGSAAPNVTITQGDITLASAYGTDVTQLSVGFTVAEDGPVNIQISDYNYATSTLEVTLTR